jgi:hypothetical protein
MTAKKAKELVREYESARTGIELLNDANVSVLNVRTNKKVITADVVYRYDDKGSVRKNKVPFSIDVLEKFRKTRVL